LTNVVAVETEHLQSFVVAKHTFKIVIINKVIPRDTLTSSFTHMHHAVNVVKPTHDLIEITLRPCNANIQFYCNVVNWNLFKTTFIQQCLHKAIRTVTQTLQALETNTQG